MEDRRGYLSYLTLANPITQTFVYQNKVVAHNGSSLTYDNGGSPANYSGSYSAPTGFKMRSLEAFQNCYITTDQGVQVLTDTAGTAARKAGAPRSLDPSYALNASASGFLTNGNQCAYRCVIQRTDVNQNVIFGYPSTRLVAYNTAGTAKNIDLTLYLAAEVTVNDVIQIYRTAQVTGTTSDIAGDEMALVYQYSPTATDITNGYITFTDSITDALRGATLYTSPSQEGIIGASDRPPLSKDVALYKNDYVLYANTSTKQRLFITLVGTAGLTGKTVKIAGVTYNFGASEIVTGAGSPQAIVGATGVAAADIDVTARSLVRIINRYSGNTSVYAYYLSGPADLPGQIMLEERGIGASAFSVQVSDTTISGMFFPPPPVSPATKSQSTSSNQVQKNGLYYSKAKQPEAVPALNYLPVGAANKSILRICALRESLIVIKEEGVYRLTGDTPQSFSVTPLDLTVYCKAADSVVVLANTVIMLSNQGVVQISDTGVQVISHEIEPNIRPLLSMPSLSTYTTGGSYESDHQFFLSTITTNTDTAQNQTYVYNIFTRTWVRWTFGMNSAVVEPGADKLYFSKPGGLIVYKERKDFADTDYCDPESSVTINSIAGKKVAITASATPQVGWVLSQSSTDLAIVAVAPTGVNSYTLTLQGAPPPSWATGAATLYPNVGMEVVWSTWTAGQQGAAMLKQVSEFAILSDNIPGNNSATALVATFASNFDENREEILIGIPGGGWGASWGAIPWGGSGDGYGYRTWVPRGKQMCRSMNPGVKHVNAREKLSVAGCAFLFDTLSERITK